MKKNYVKIVSLFGCILSHSIINAQCGAVVGAGSSSNLFTNIRNATNPVAADKVLNTVVFAHRNNAGTFGGNSGNLRYDVSFNAGVTWTLNQGVLNPVSSSLGRYPNVAIYNPTANTTPSNAYLGYMAATISTVNSAFNGLVSGVRQLSGSGNTENYNQPIISQQFIPHSLVKGAPGVFWAVDALYNGTNITGFTIYKGTWNSSLSDIVWANNFTVAPSFNTGLVTTGAIGDYNIAFDPTGTVGWFSFLGHVTPGPTNYAYYPVLYKTTNGGASWTGPIQVNLNTFSCMMTNIASGNVVTTNFEHDLAVDVNGNPHLFTTICNGNNAYSVFYGQWHHMYDITLSNGLWAAYDVANVLTGRGTWGTSPNNTSQDMAPQATRSADGTKIFFTWTDNSSYTLGQAGLTPNLFGRGYNVTNNTWTPIKDFTSCNSSYAGQAFVPHVAPEVLEPSSTVYKLAPVLGVMTTSDPALTANFNFLDNVTFATTDFSVNAPYTPTVSIAQGSSALLCPNATISIGLSGNYGQALWSTGATTTVISVSSPTITSYSVVAQQNCYVGTATISVTNMSATASGPSSSICVGASATLNATGNAVSYSWTPGPLGGTMAVVSPTTTTIYTLTANGNANCSIINTVAVNVIPLPSITIAGSSSVCIGSVITLTAAGAVNYTWNPGPTTAIASFTPQNSNQYMVTGADANNCTNTQTFNVAVLPVPTVSAISDKTVICAGGNIYLSAGGAITYSWSSGATTPNTNETPSITTIYTVTGYDANLCSSARTIQILVNPLPNVLVSTTPSNVCVGDRVVVTATGAATYFWSNAQTNNSFTTNVTNTSQLAYTVVGTSTAGCNSKVAFSQTVNACAGINELSGQQAWLQVYPNPSNGEFSIKASNLSELSLVNELGQVIKSIVLSESQSYDLKMNKLASGVYFIVGKNANGYLREKVVINN